MLYSLLTDLKHIACSGILDGQLMVIITANVETKTVGIGPGTFWTAPKPSVHKSAILSLC